MPRVNGIAGADICIIAGFRWWHLGVKRSRFYRVIIILSTCACRKTKITAEIELLISSQVQYIIYIHTYFAIFVFNFLRVIVAGTNKGKLSVGVITCWLTTALTAFCARATITQTQRSSIFGTLSVDGVVQLL